MNDYEKLAAKLEEAVASVPIDAEISMDLDLSGPGGQNPMRLELRSRDQVHRLIVWLRCQSD